MKRPISILVSLSLATPMAWAQPKPMSRPLPPPSAPSAPSSSAPTDASKKSGLTDAQRSKFAKANPEDITNENFPETIESFDFPNVDINDVIKAISELTGKNFIIDPGVRGKITIVAPSKITVAEAYKAFLSALAINGFTVVPSGSFLKVKLARNAQRDSIETYSGTYYPNTDQLITRIINLKHIQAEQVTRDLRVLVSTNGEINHYAPTNSIIISDFGSNIDRVMKILNQLDVPGFEDQLEVIPVRYGKAKDLADLVDRIVNKGEKGNNSRGGTFSSGVPRFTRSGPGQGGGGFFMAIPDDRTNSIVVTGSKGGIARVKKLLQQLDFRIKPEDSGGVHVYYVKYGDADKIATVLQGVAKEGAPKPAAGGAAASPFAPVGAPSVSTGMEIFGGDVKISADKNTNSLVIVASKQDYEIVLSLLSKLDIARNQVFVEAIIMEMKAGVNDDWKIGYYQFNESGVGKTGFNGGINLQDVLSPGGTSGTIISFAQGKTINVTDPTTKTTLALPSLVGFINFLKRTTKANILSRPQITVIDNQEGEIEVGDRVPIGFTSVPGINGAPATTTANFEDASIKLKIKPFISPATDSVRMEIEQKIAQPTTIDSLPKALSDQTQVLAKRSIKTSIVVNDGDTAIIGGLMRDQDTETISKVPLLGDLPIIGWLFKSRNTDRQKTNLTVFLTPKVIRSSATQKMLVGQQLDHRLDYIKSQGGKDPFGSTTDEIQSKIGNQKTDESNSIKQ
jgi:general secretion pathway protein D